MEHVARIEKSEDHTTLFVRSSDTLRETLDKFRANPSMRLLAVVDPENTPLGVIREVDIRNLLFNPFGHALMSNPGFGMDIKGLIRQCAVAEHSLDSPRWIAAFSRHVDSPGLILTSNGSFVETLSSDRLLELMSQGRMARAEKIARSSQAFTEEILALSGQLSTAANKVHSLSESLGGQANGMADAAQNVAAGATQSSMGLQDVNERGRNLANAMEQLTVVASEAKMVRARTKDVIDAAAPQMTALAESGLEIRNIIEVIHNVGRQTNFLALNAQIEAVRHDANTHGFIAVAGEIKQLAKQTRGSANEVSTKVDRIGKAVGDVLAGHGEIVEAMDRISTISGQIDTAVEEQSATSLVIAGFVAQAADATADISMRAGDIGKRAHQVQTSAKELERVSELLLVSATDISDRSREFVQTIQYA